MNIVFENYFHNKIVLVADEACRPSRPKSRTATIPYRLITSYYLQQTLISANCIKTFIKPSKNERSTKYWHAENSFRFKLFLCSSYSNGKLVVPLDSVAQSWGDCPPRHSVIELLGGTPRHEGPSVNSEPSLWTARIGLWNLKWKL